MATKQKNINSAQTRVFGSRGIKAAPKINKLLVSLILLMVVGFGTWLLFFANAASNNCQKQEGDNKTFVQICDVDQIASGSDTVLSTDGEATNLAAKGWGIYYGAAFRAPKATYKGAVPITRIYNKDATWHDYLTELQKNQKEAKYGKGENQGIPFFAWRDDKVPGTVPVYRLTRMGGATQPLFTTDKALVDKLVAQDANNPDGWKLGKDANAIAFYAYPPNYKAGNQDNPYDCSVIANFNSDRCKGAREKLVNAVNNGSIPKDDKCPKTLTAYLKAPFPGQFSADCQKFWNTYMQDCSITENFTSDRCKVQREALAKAQAEQARKRAEEAAAQAAAAAAAQQQGGGSNGGAVTRPSCSRNCAPPPPITPGTCDGINRSNREQVRRCQKTLGVATDGIWGPQTQAAYDRAHGGGGGNSAAAQYLRDLAAAKARCAAKRPPMYADPQTLQCKQYGMVVYPTNHTYNCELRGQTLGMHRDGTYFTWGTMSRNFTATSADDARAQCARWRTSLNVQSTYKGFYIVDIGRVN